MMSNSDMNDEKPIRLGVSSCLLGNKVRFDGGHKRDRFDGNVGIDERFARASTKNGLKLVNMLFATGHAAVLLIEFVTATVEGEELTVESQE